MEENIPNLDFKSFNNQFNDILEAAANNLERQWPAKYAQVDSARVIFFTRMRIAMNTYHSIMWLTADLPRDPRRNPLKFSDAPLVRTLFEELITIIFTLHDVKNLVPYLIMTDYTELWLERRHVQKYHGSNPKWDTYISNINKHMERLSRDLKLSKKQNQFPLKYIGRWPTPGKAVIALKEHFPKSNAITFIEYVNSWMYRTLSGDSHLNFRGLRRRGIYYAPKEAKAVFGEENYKAKLKELSEDYKMEMMWATFSLLLSIVSEIEAHFKFGLADRAKYLWIIFIAHSDMAKEFYEKRYSNLLS